MPIVEGEKWDYPGREGRTLLKGGRRGPALKAKRELPKRSRDLKRVKDEEKESA